jgi:FtsH-binding integral membrane protein
MLALDAVGGCFWIAAYVLIIRQGFRDRTYGVPSVALWMNLTWEYLFTFKLHRPGLTPPLVITATWLGFDCVILGQYLRYGKKEFGRTWPQLRGAAWFYAQAALEPLCLAPLIYIVLRELGDPTGSLVAYGMNSLMSYLFIDLLARRGDLRGQSLSIAACKLLGSALPAVRLHLTLPTQKVLHGLFFIVLVLDSLYLFLLYRLYRQSRRAGSAGPSVPRSCGRSSG